MTKHRVRCYKLNHNLMSRWMTKVAMSHCPLYQQLDVQSKHLLTLDRKLMQMQKPHTVEIVLSTSQRAHWLDAMVEKRSRWRRTTWTFCPMVRLESVCTLIALSVQHDLELHQIDVTTAFLNGQLKEEVFMKLPEGRGQDNLVWCLNKVCMV